MRHIITLLLVLASPVILAQTTWIADNNFNAPTGPNVFSTIQAAVNAASPGDIIQVQPSPTVYGSVTIRTKNLTLMGIGFNVDKDIPHASVLLNITLTNNADNTSDADSTTITGLQFDYLYLGINTGPAYVLENILVYNNGFDYIFAQSGSPTDGLEVRDCWTWNASYAIYSSNYLTNAVIRNNLMYSSIYLVHTTPGNNIIANNILYGGIQIDATGTNTPILNNIFVGQTGSETAFDSKLRDCIVSNNIFYGSTPSISAGGSTSTNFQRNVFTNNLVFATGDDTMPPRGGGVGNSGSGNLTGSPIFGNSQLLNTYSSAYDFTLQTGSPALAPAGSDGTAIGISGGLLYPWPVPTLVLKTTAAPVIQILNTSTVINPNDDLPVRIKAKSN
jgi:hypothetical protein